MVHCAVVNVIANAAIAAVSGSSSAVVAVVAAAVISLCRHPPTPHPKNTFINTLYSR